MLMHTLHTWACRVPVASSIYHNSSTNRLLHYSSALQQSKRCSGTLFGRRRQEDTDQNFYRIASRSVAERVSSKDGCETDPFASAPALPDIPEETQDETEEKRKEDSSTNQGPWPYYLLAFGAVMGAGIGYLTILLCATAELQFWAAFWKVCRRLLKTVALRQLLGVVGAMCFIRYGLEPLVKFSRRLFATKGTWENSKEYFILRDVYQPLEFLFFTAALTTLVENFLPQLMALPKMMVQTFVRSTLSLTFVLTAAKVVFNIKGRILKRSEFDATLSSVDAAKYRRMEALDKLLSVLTLIVGSVFALQAIGLDVTSILAIGGVGGLAVGIASREVLENVFTGLTLLTSRPFDIGDEVMFKLGSGQVVEGFVLDIGWYRTTIRSFEREIFNIPNSVFSRNVVLNITRKEQQWRFFEFLGVRVEDMDKVASIVRDMRTLMNRQTNVIKNLHRRVFLDKVTRDQVSIYISCYVAAPNRDAFMNIKQEMLLGMVDCIERNNAKLARNRLHVQVETIHAAGPNSSSANPSEASTGGKTRPMLPSPEDITPVPPPPRPPPASPLPPQDSKEGKGAPPARGGDKELTPSSGPTLAPPASPLPRIPVPASADTGDLKHADGRGIGREAAVPVVAPLRSSVVTPALKKPVGTSQATVAQVNLNIPSAYDDIN